MAHKHTGNILICNVCNIKMCFDCASAIVETGEWVHRTCKSKAENELEANYSLN